MAEPSVAIIIPTYNRPALVQKAVESVLAQSPRPQEVIVVDDGSTDGTPEILARFRGEITVLKHSGNRGALAAKNTGLSSARSDWLGILDSDDELLPGALERLLEAIRTSPSSVGTVIGNCVQVPGGDFTGKGVNRDTVLGYEDFLSGRVRGEFWGLFRREVLGGRRFDERLRGGFESTLWFELYKQALVYYVHHPVRLYRRGSSGQLTDTKNVLQDARRVAFSYRVYLQLYGADLQRIAPDRLAYFLRRLAFFDVLAGQRCEAVRIALRSLAIGPSVRGPRPSRGCRDAAQKFDRLRWESSRSDGQMKILLVVSSLGRGGAQRAGANLSKVIGERHEVAVVALHDPVEYPHGGRLLGPIVPFNCSLHRIGRVRRIVKKAVALRKILTRELPEAVISFGDGPNLLTVLASRVSLPARIVLNQQVAPLRNYSGAEKLVFGFLMRAFYPRADALVVPSEGMRQEYASIFGLSPRKVHCIPNPLALRDVEVLSEEPAPEFEGFGDRPVILTVGRLCRQKNHRLLLTAFAVVRREVPAKLVLVGVGELEGSLRRYAADLGLAPDVHFLGWQENPFRLMRRADCFVLSSDYEGFANVLVEAMACGCPVVATDCPWGPREILDGGRYGRLVPCGNVEAMAAELVALLRDSTTRIRLRQLGRIRARAFSLDIIAQSWESLLLGLSERSRAGC